MKRLLINLLAVFTVFMYACDIDESNLTDDEPIVVTAEIAEQKLKSNTDEFKDDIIGILRSEGTEATMDALVNLMNLMYEDYDEEWKLRNKKDLAKKNVSFQNGLKKLVNFSVPNQQKFRNASTKFEDDMIYGIYEWNFGTEDFDLIDDSVDFLEVRFPTQNSNSNNANLKITDVEIDDYIPLSVNVSLNVNSTLMLSIDYSGTFDDEWPTQLALDVYLNPIDMRFRFNDSNQVLNIASSVKNGEKIITATDVDINYNGNLDDEDIVKISGHYQLIQLFVKGEVDIQGLDNAPSGSDFNDYHTLQLFENDILIGNIFIEEEERTDEWGSYTVEVVYVELDNGDKVLIDDFMEDMIDEIADEIDALADRWSF